MLNLGSVPAGTTIYIPFATYGGVAGESITCTGLDVTDIEIYKNGSTTQRASDAGYTLLDTDGIDFDSKTGIHGFSIDLNDNSDAGFYAVGSWYWVVVSSITVDSQIVNFIAATFRIVAAEAVTGVPVADAKAISGDETAANNLESACDNYSVTRGLAGTALPDAASGAAGGLAVSAAGSLALDTLADWVNGGRLDLIIDSLVAAVITNAAGTDIAADIIALKAETAAILLDTGTDGVVLAADAISSEKITTGAFTADAFADDCFTDDNFPEDWFV